MSSSLEPQRAWILANYARQLESVQQILAIAYVVFAFCSALIFGALKALLVGPVAAVVLIVGNISVILGSFPIHIYWTVYTLIKIHQIDAAFKCAFLFALPILLGLWLGLSIFGSILVGIGYGIFTPWISTFEAFRENSTSEKFIHCIVDGTLGTIKGSCTVVRDFADICFHSYPLYLKELREKPNENQIYSIRLMEVPACVVVALVGLVVDIPLFTIIALIKSPYMLFKGWLRLSHDLISREGPFLEIVCVPIAGLVILMWPLVVVGSILLAIVSSIFIGLYGAVIVYQEKSFRRGVAFIVAIVAEFDEYTNDCLYLREGSLLPRPRYRKRKMGNSEELSIGRGSVRGPKSGSSSSGAPASSVTSLAPSRSIREVIQEIKMVQIWEEMMISLERSGKELIDTNVITSSSLTEWLRTKGSNPETVDIGLPSYCTLWSLLRSIKAGSNGMLMSTGLEITYMNRPQDRLLDWIFHPIMVLMEQIKAIELSENETKYLENLVLFPKNSSAINTKNDDAVMPNDIIRAGQIQAMSRRLVGITRSVSKFPTYRRRFRQVVKVLLNYSLEREGKSYKHHSVASVSAVEDVVSVV